MHDKNGNPVKRGDRVSIEAEIAETYATDEFCNVQLKIGEEGQEHGAHNVTATVTVNARQTTLIKSGVTEKSPAES